MSSPIRIGLLHEMSEGPPCPTDIEQWLHLIESQERCFEVFTDFADEALRAHWQQLQDGAGTAELERLRRIGCAAPGGTLVPDLGPVWFDCCTRRIDAMRLVEDRLADELRSLCERKTAQARTELAQYEALLATVQAQGADADTPMPAGFFDAAPAPGGNELADASGTTGSDSDPDSAMPPAAERPSKQY